MNLISILLVVTLAFRMDSKTYPEEYKTPFKLTNSASSKNISTLEHDKEFNNNIESLIARGIVKLTFAIDNTLQTPITLGNLVYSPVNIAGALALILMGSSGKTFEEIASAMGLNNRSEIESNYIGVHEHFGKLLAKFDRTSDVGEQIKLATAIFVQNDFPIKPQYKEASETFYKSEVLNLDFKNNANNARRLINAWISDRTNSKITDMLPSPPADTTRIIVASALYFNAAWEYPFFDGTIYTKRRKFYPNGRGTESKTFVEVMWNSGTFPYYKDTRMDCEIIGFPYKGNKTTMYAIMPTASNVERLHQLEARLTASELERLIENMKYKYVDVLFPKMKLESSIDLTATLKHLGVKSLFIPGEANLSLLARSNTYNKPSPHARVNNPQSELPINLSNRFPVENTNEKKFDDKLGERVGRKTTADSLDNLRSTSNSDPNNKNIENPGLYVDKVLHKVYVDITETGTEAAAATAVYLDKILVRSFNANVPFLFFIRHEETKLILFWGSVRTPTPNFT